jgi:RHS repeat-associated protein
MIFFKNESLLHYNYYRTYNPDTGRYMQSDPIGLAAGANTYNYVGGNPLSGVDPLGLDTINFGLKDWWFSFEEYMKTTGADYDSPNVLRLLSHGRPDYMHGNQPIQMAKQIVNGVFMTDSGAVVNHFFTNRMKQNQDIYIKMDACSTGAYATSGKGTPQDPTTVIAPYAYEVGKFLREFIKKNKSSSHIFIDAPNGPTTYDYFTGDRVGTPEFSPNYNGTTPRIIRYKF